MSNQKTLVMPHLAALSAIAALPVSSDSIKKAKTFASTYEYAKLSKDHSKEVVSGLRDQVSRFKNVASFDDLKKSIESTVKIIEQNLKTSQNGAGDVQTRDHQPQQHQQAPQGNNRQQS